MTENDLCFVSAGDAITKFKARQLSPVDLVAALIARSEAVNPHLTAFTTTHFERAHAQARRAEAKYMRKGARLRRLEGVPIAIKDLHPIKGEITTFGSRIFAQNRDSVTSPSVARLLNAGAIVLARTATPEFGAATICHSPLWGISRNPWNTDYSPGGSSGGSGAALAAGMTTLADGSDYGGSIRIPAAACGIFGYKPPFGRIPRLAPGSLDTFGHCGPMTRGVRDAALMLEIMSGTHPGDIMSLPGRARIPRPLPDVRGMRIAFSMDLGYFQVDQEVQDNTRSAVTTFRDLGCHVEEVEIGWTSAVLSAFLTRAVAGFSARIAPYLPRWRFEMSDYVRAVAEEGLNISAAEIFAAQEFQSEMFQKLSPIFAKFDLMVCPTLALPSLPADQSPLALNVTINGKRLLADVQWALTYPFNMISQCPVASVPSGFSTSRVPTGVQIVGRPYDDASVFRAALAYEAARPWLDRHETRPTLGA
jgi:Asp-tRNA(Asn)/Glu-tRNA(Gln) amidotransferase A subunit family amidase